jgi:hypothetical protein
MHLWGEKKLPLDPASAVLVEIHPDSGPPKITPLAYEDDMVVQSVLTKSGAVKRFRRMNVSLVRPLPEGKGPHKMDVKFEYAKRHVAPENDYALRPGDKIVVTEDTTTALDDALEAVAGPFKVFARRK